MKSILVETMDAIDKRTPVSFRLTLRHKRCLEMAARNDQRSQTNFVEKLISDYCELHGIDPDAEDLSKIKKPRKA